MWARVWFPTLFLVWLTKMAEFEPSKFLEDILNRSAVAKLRRSDVELLIDHLELGEVIPVKDLKKPALVAECCDQLIKLGFFGDEAYQGYEDKIQAERAKEVAKQAEREQAERAEREKKAEREHEYRMRELDLRASSVGVTGAGFSVAQQVRLVPKFNEKDVEKYFLAFEKTAISLKWPKDQWTMLLQTALSGKALDTYSALPIDEITHYDSVKGGILKAYELVPEAYRQKFRKLQKNPNITHVEFAREKKILLDRWLESLEGSSDLNKLKEIILLEEFKNSISQDIRLHLEDRKIENLQSAATAADEYALIHKVNVQQGSKNSKWRQKSSQSPSQTSESNKVKEVNDGEVEKNDNETKSKKRFKPFWCDHCHRKGHSRDRCYILHPELKPVQAESKPVSFLKLLQNSSGCEVSGQSVGKHAELSPYDSFKCDGVISVSDDSENVPVDILRDTGSAQSLVLDEVIKDFELTPVGHVWVQGIGCQDTLIPLYEIWLKSSYFTGKVTVGAISKLPMDSVSFLLGNDIAGDQVNVIPKLTFQPCVDDQTEGLNVEYPGIFPACVTTRSMKKREVSDVIKGRETKNLGLDENVILAETFMNDLHESPDTNGESHSDVVLSKKGLCKYQNQDSSLLLVRNQAVSYDEIYKFPVGYYWKEGVLMRKWRSSTVPANESWKEIHQIVLPKCYRNEVVQVAHELPMSGHLGVRKTQDRILRHFYWPGLYGDVAEYCRSCHTCQLVGKPNQTIPPAPLIPIPAFGNPFDSIIVDCVGPLPKTRSGNYYLLTIMDSVTRFPEAIPLKRITSKNVVSALTQFFTRMGLARVIRSDQGSNFTSGLFQEVLKELGIKHKISSAYHPQSQGALERFHQTFKTMLKSFCYDHETDWDKGVDMLLFAIREVPNESLGFSPFELVYGYEVRGPLKMFKEKLVSQEDQKPVAMLKYVTEFKTRLNEAREMAKTHLLKSQSNMKVWYDRKSRTQEFSQGDQVLLLLPIPGNCLQSKFSGPYKVLKKLNSVDYLIHTPDRKKTKRVCHVNMIKPYHVRATVVSCVNAGDNTCQNTGELDDLEIHLSRMSPSPVLNSEVLANIASKLSHLSEKQKSDVTQLLNEFQELFTDVPGRTTLLEHDIVLLEGTRPIKQHPYRMNPVKHAALKKEVEYMLQNDLIEASESPWSSPVIMVPKPDNTFRMCIDLRKVNCVTKTDSHPIPRIESCFDKIGEAKFVSKFDLLKGYWQVPLTGNSKEITAFATPDNLYQCKVMCFGLKNAPSSFSRLMQKVIAGLEGCAVFIDDVAICSDSWPIHMTRVKALFQKLSEAHLTINLAKSEIGHGYITYLGYKVGQGKVLPKKANVEAIEKIAVPTNRKGVMKFLGSIGYYRKFCKNFSDIAVPLTRLLCKNTKFCWSAECQIAFKSLKQLIMKAPVLIVPDCSKPFILMVDASDVGVGSVLMQVGEDELDHPVGYFSRKLNKHQLNYSTVEKETLSLVLAVQHFEIYLSVGAYPVKVYTDHNPLKYLNQFRNKNQRLTRWSLFLQEYNLEIFHIPGKENVLADSLSRAGV